MYSKSIHPLRFSDAHSVNCFQLLSLWIRRTLELLSRADVTPYGYHETKRKNTVIPTGCKISPGTKTEIGCDGVFRGTHNSSEPQIPGI